MLFYTTNLKSHDYRVCYPVDKAPGIKSGRYRYILSFIKILISNYTVTNVLNSQRNESEIYDQQSTEYCHGR
jgi:hypothetical protein